MEETWVDIPKFEGCYQVSNLGRVRSLDRTITDKNGRRMKYKGKFMECPISNSTGYRSVTMKNAGRYKVQWIHILVCEAFHGPKLNMKQPIEMMIN